MDIRCFRGTQNRDYPNGNADGDTDASSGRRLDTAAADNANAAADGNTDTNTNNDTDNGNTGADIDTDRADDNNAGADINAVAAERDTFPDGEAGYAGGYYPEDRRAGYGYAGQTFAGLAANRFADVADSCDGSGGCAAVCRRLGWQ